jgi:CheY-like chemotaxis protein
LPGLDGYGVARRVRSELGRDVLLVALTGYGQPEDRARALDAGFDVHLTKPVDFARLEQLLAHDTHASHRH